MTGWWARFDGGSPTDGCDCARCSVVSPTHSYAWLGPESRDAISQARQIAALHAAGRATRCVPTTAASG
jgi:hypothetical protein